MPRAPLQPRARRRPQGWRLPQAQSAPRARRMPRVQLIQARWQRSLRSRRRPAAPSSAPAGLPPPQVRPPRVRHRLRAPRWPHRPARPRPSSARALWSDPPLRPPGQQPETRAPAACSHRSTINTLLGWQCPHDKQRRPPHRRAFTRPVGGRSDHRRWLDLGAPPCAETERAPRAAMRLFALEPVQHTIRSMGIPLA
jgi:hypothetical protein